MNGAVPKIWIVLLNWNGLDDTLACLESLGRCEFDGLETTLLVIDNASDIDPQPAIAARFPDVHVERSTRNLGFAAGCNRGMQMALEAGADYVLLLNNDTLVEPRFLRELVRFAEANPTAGVVAPVICYTDRPDTVWFAGANIVLAVGYFEHRYRNRPRASVPPRPFATAYASGCCMLLRRDVLERIGMFDQRFFAYFEDADLCLRARQHGFQVVCVPRSVIWHKESASTRRDLKKGTTSPLKHYLVARNRIRTVRKHAAPLQLLTFLLVGTTLRTAFYLCAFAARRRWEKLAFYALGVVDGLRKRAALYG